MSTPGQPSVISEDLRDGLLINNAISGILGFLLNIGIVCVLIRKLRKGAAHTDIKLCSFVAITDLFVSLGIIARVIYSKYPYNLLKYNVYWCKADVSTTGQLLLVSGYSLAVMSMERFLLICFNIQLSVYFWFSLIAISWSIQFILIWVSVAQDLQILTKIETYCSIINQKTGVIGYSIVFSLFFISFFSVIFGYICIAIVKFRQCLNQINMNIPKEKVYAEFRSTLTKSLINILIYSAVFSGKIYTWIYEFVTGNRRTLIMDIVSNSLIVYTSVVNTLILLYMNQEVRRSYFEFLKDLKFKIFGN